MPTRADGPLPLPFAKDAPAWHRYRTTGCPGCSWQRIASCLGYELVLGIRVHRAVVLLTSVKGTLPVGAL